MDVSSFEEVFEFDPHWFHDSATVEAVLAHRRKLENELFFDRLLRLLRVENGSSLYPPRSHHDLRRLHQRIVSSPVPEHQQQSLLYYLLLDCRTHPQASKSFAARVFLPEQYRTYIEGLWSLDHLHLSEALNKLTQPSLIPTFPEEILHTLLQHSSNDLTIPLAYHHAVSPPLTTPKVLEAFFSALCTVSVTDALYFARGHDGSAHRDLVERVVAHVLGQAVGDTRAAQGIELVNFPLTEEESGWLEEYLTTGKGRKLSGAKDTLTMRRLAEGNYAALLEDTTGPGGRKIDGINWAFLKGGLKRGVGASG